MLKLNFEKADGLGISPSNGHRRHLLLLVSMTLPFNHLTYFKHKISCHRVECALALQVLQSGLK